MCAHDCMRLHGWLITSSVTCLNLESYLIVEFVKSSVLITLDENIQKCHVHTISPKCNQFADKVTNKIESENFRKQFTN